MKTRLIMIFLMLSLAAFAFGIGNAVQFDGVNDYVQVTSSLGITNSYTVVRMDIPDQFRWDW